MEELLLIIVQESSGYRHAALKKAAQDAHDLLCRQHGSFRDPSHELRTTCLLPLQLALETKKPKHMSLALNGLHKLIRDERFYTGMEPENDSLWLPSQVLRATASVCPLRPPTNGRANTQGGGAQGDALVNILRVLLAMACSPACTLNGRIVIEILTRCGECWDTGCRSVRAAAQATASQTLRTFCSFLDEEWRDLIEQDSNWKPNQAHDHYRITQIEINGEIKPYNSKSLEIIHNLTSTSNLNGVNDGETFYNNVKKGVNWNASAAVAVYSEVIPVMQFLTNWLDVSNIPQKPCETALYILECLLTLLTSLPMVVHENAHFTTFLWQKFCPALVSFLGTPKVDKHFISRDYTLTLESGRGSGVLGSAPTLTVNGARCVYLVVGELVRLVGGEGSLRPVLEALFHRALLYPPPQYRGVALRWIRDIFKSPERVLDLTLLVNQKEKQSCSDDMAILRLIMDSLEECSTLSSGPQTAALAVQCVTALLTSLQALGSGVAVTPRTAAIINNKYHFLKDVDYLGPLVYQSLARLPVPYRDAVANLKTCTSTDSGSDSEISGNQEIHSDNSGDTEGPEDCASDSETPDRSWMRAAPVWDSLHPSLPITNPCDVDVERHNAKIFAKKLRQDLVPKLLRLRTSVEVDECLQDFASRCCRQTENPSMSDIPIMNADGVYLATYSALLLSLQLLQLGHYDTNNIEAVKVPLSETEFVEEVQNSGILVYLSSAWLCELYQQVLAQCPIVNLSDQATHISKMDPDFAQVWTKIASLLTRVKSLPTGCESPLERSAQKRSSGDSHLVGNDFTLVSKDAIFVQTCAKSGSIFDICVAWSVAYKVNASTEQDKAAGCRSALVDLLTDLGGLGTSQMLSEWQRLQAVAEFVPELSPEAQAGSKQARRILTCCWDSMVAILSFGLGVTSKTTQGRTAKLKRIIKQKTSKNRKANEGLVSNSLEGLHKAATLSNTLSLQQLSSSILSLLSNNVCSEKTTTLSSDHALSLDVLLTGGLELGSHNMLCWPAVLNACRHVCRLEHALFTGPAPPVPIQATPTDRPSMAFNLGEDDETCVDVYSFLSASSSRISVSSVLGQLDGPLDAPLKPVYAARALCALSQQVDALFHDAALKLALPALCEFLKSLCHASRDQLFNRSNNSLKARTRWWSRDRAHASEPPTLLLHRVGGVTLKIVQSARPLLHTMRVWTIVGPHLMEAACHKDREVSSRAVSYIHDCVTALLSEQAELPHFHFNEALLKPFENLICLDLCDSDVQDQIVSCLCETVEAHSFEIQSGWRPLFGTLRGAQGSVQHYHSISDILRVFLNNENPLVFANAALDCILCLLTHVRGNNNPENEKDCTNDLNVGLEALKFLENCAENLSNMYSMPKCPPFNSAHRIQDFDSPQTVDPTLQTTPNIELFETNEYSNETHSVSYKVLSTCSETSFNISHMDNASGILKVWFLMLEGLASATIICPRMLQPKALETLFKLLKELMYTPGPHFGLYCINHLLLPMVQNWMRQTNTVKAWDNMATNFKQCVGMASELIVSYLHDLQSDKDVEQITIDTTANRLKCTIIKRPVNNLKYGQLKTKSSSMDITENITLKSMKYEEDFGDHQGVTLALKQLLIILTECTTQPNEIIARLGVSCIRHVILSTGSVLTTHQWDIACVTMHRACDVTLTPMKQLSLAFNENSDSFYGDSAIVKVAARKDCTIEDNLRLNSLAQQVLLLDSQRDCKVQSENTFIDDRSYVFLLYQPNLSPSVNAEIYSLRVPYRNLIVGLLAHQMLLQTIASILLHGNSNVPSLANILLESNSIPNSFNDKLNQKHVEILVKCLTLSFYRGSEFDSRPGLKFLLQKVSNIECAANLYKQTTSAWIIKMVVLIELCLAGIRKYNMSAPDISYILESCENSDEIKKYECFVRYLFELKATWESLCDSYANKTYNQETVNRLSASSEESVNKEEVNALNDEELEDDVFIVETVTSPKTTQKPFQFNDFKTQHSYDSTSSSEYDDEVSVTEHVVCGKIVKRIEIQNKEVLKDNSAVNGSTENVVDVHKEAENVLQNYKERKCLSTNAYTNIRTNPFNGKAGVIAPQPVPPEIEQQRVLSINKDNEARRATLSQSLGAILELCLSLPNAVLACLRVAMLPGAESLKLHSSEPAFSDAVYIFCQNRPISVHTPDLIGSTEVEGEVKR